MVKNETIRAIQQTGEQDIQEIVQAAMGRYGELYPRWKMLYLSADTEAGDRQSRKILRLIKKADKLMIKNR